MIVNRRDLDFLFYEVLDLDVLLRAPRFEAYDCEAISAILDTAQAIAEDKYLACAGELDVNEPVLDNGKVSTLPVVKEALDAFAEAGFFGATFDEVVGGWQLPYLVNMAVSGMFSCANTGIFDYSFLTVATASLLNTFGSEEQKKHYLPPMLEGRWFGTMCLSEPQAGSSLSDIRTMAEPSDAKHYRITGTKMWISGGDQEISENIVHAVLAKIVGGPLGVKGISLFIVPKYRVNSDGSLGERNNVALAGLNHKMGHRGITNTLLNFGEAGECRGYLVGKPHQGLKYMFHMMNEARIGVGHGAVMSGLAGYLYSLDYARSRPQGRHPHNKDPNTPQLMIIEHAERFGLAQLHQLRGRVGRGAAQSSCVLLYKQPLGEIARERLNVVRNTEDGFLIAEEDLRLRGGGEVLGTRQSGLPAFRIAQLPEHQDLLAAARDEARLCLTRMPHLAGERGERLRLLLYLFERDDAVKLMRAG